MLADKDRATAVYVLSREAGELDLLGLRWKGCDLMTLGGMAVRFKGCYSLHCFPTAVILGILSGF